MGVILARLRDLFSSIKESDGESKPSPYQVANTQLSHEAIGVWTTLGLMVAYVSPYVAALLSVVMWGVTWEYLQYRSTGTVRVLRDWLLGDLPAYTIGAVACATVLYGASGYLEGRWVEYLVATLALVTWPAVSAVIFGRIK